MKKKKLMVTIAVTIAILAALGTTVALAAESDGEVSRGARGWFGQNERPLDEDHLAQLIEDGLLTQEQVDSIASGDAHIFDFLDSSDRPQHEERLLSEDHLAQLIEDGLLTQEQADSITSGDAHIFDFLDSSDRPQHEERLLNEDHLAQLIEDGLLTQEQADSITSGDSHIFDFLDPSERPQREGVPQGEGSLGTPRGRGGQRMDPKTD